MIACLASFRVLFVKQDSTRRKTPGHPTEHSSRRRLLGTRALKSWLSTKERLPDHEPSKHGTLHKKKSHGAYPSDPRSSESGEHIIPLQGIRVQRDFEATSFPRAME